MELEVLKKIAQDAQAMARRYAHHQNLGNITLGDPPPIPFQIPQTIRGRLKWLLFGVPKPPEPVVVPQTTIRTEEVTKIVNALLNSGNALEYMLKGVKVESKEEVVA